MKDVFARHDVCQVQTTPPVNAATAQEPKQAAGFVLSIWPQFCGANRKFDLSLVVSVFHRDPTAKAANGCVDRATAPPSSLAGRRLRRNSFIR